MPFEESRENATTLAYEAFHRLCNLGSGPVGSFLAWLRTVKAVSPSGVVLYRSQQERTLAVAVRCRGVSGGFPGQLCTMLLPHGGPEDFVGGPKRAAMLSHLNGLSLLGRSSLVPGLAAGGGRRLAV